MVTVTVPVVAVLLAARLKVLVPVVLLGLKVGVTPLGKPVADKFTLALNPFCGVTVIVLVPLAPCAIDKLFGDAEREKLGGTVAVTVRETVVVFVRAPEVPEIVMGKDPVVAVLLAASVSVMVPVVLLLLKVGVTPLG